MKILERKPSLSQECVNSPNRNGRNEVPAMEVRNEECGRHIPRPTAWESREVVLSRNSRMNVSKCITANGRAHNA